MAARGQLEGSLRARQAGDRAQVRPGEPDQGEHPGQCGPQATTRASSFDLKALYASSFALADAWILPPCQLCHMELGQLHLKCGDPQSALKSFTKTREFNSTGPQALAMAMSIIEARAFLPLEEQWSPLLTRFCPPPARHLPLLLHPDSTLHRQGRVGPRASSGPHLDIFRPALRRSSTSSCRSDRARR